MDNPKYEVESPTLERMRFELDHLRERGRRLHDREVQKSVERLSETLESLQPLSTPGEDWISIGEAMEMSGRPRSTIKGWVERGLLSGKRRRTNHELFVRRDELSHLLELRDVHHSLTVPADFAPREDFVVSGRPPADGDVD